MFNIAKTSDWIYYLWRFRIATLSATRMITTPSASRGSQELGRAQNVFGCDPQLPAPGEDVAISINCKCAMESSLCLVDNAISSKEAV
jgi:hypothetical protein